MVAGPGAFSSALPARRAFDCEHRLKSIKGSATSIEKTPGQQESKLSVDNYVEMKSEERHHIPVILKTILPGIYPWNTKLTK